MLMDIALDVGAKLPSADDDDGDGDDTAIRTKTSQAAEDFMEEFPLAKIVVIIDTHCSETGFFLWRGDRKGDFETSPLLPVSTKHCRLLFPSFTLLQILRDCIPQGIFKYLSSAEASPNHTHKALIVNLSCGPSINKAESRHSLLEG